MPHGLNNKDFLFCDALYAVHYDKNENFEPCANDEGLKKDLPDVLYSELSVIREKLGLDFHIGNLERHCFLLNQFFWTINTFFAFSTLRKIFTACNIPI